MIRVVGKFCVNFFGGLCGSLSLEESIRNIWLLGLSTKTSKVNAMVRIIVDEIRIRTVLP